MAWLPVIGEYALGANIYFFFSHDTYNIYPTSNNMNIFICLFQLNKRTTRKMKNEILDVKNKSAPSVTHKTNV